MTFQFFDPNAGVSISHGHLPHWEQAGATYFLTFRTADSIPTAVLQQWVAQRALWLERHGIDPADNDWQKQVELLPLAQRREFSREFSRKWHDELDRCHGACVLRQPELAQVVADSLLHFDGARYEMGDFVVMPNHVHLLVGIQGWGAMRRRCRSWKKFTGTAINRRLGLKGEFWQTEGFDHLVRNADSFEKIRDYIADNPVKARLKIGEYLLHVR